MVNFFYGFISNPYLNTYFSGCVANIIFSFTFHLIVMSVILFYLNKLSLSYVMHSLIHIRALGS